MAASIPVPPEQTGIKADILMQIIKDPLRWNLQGWSRLRSRGGSEELVEAAEGERVRNHCRAVKLDFKHGRRRPL